MNRNFNVYLTNAALFFISAFILIIPSLINGYPLLFSDTGTYLFSGHEGFVPVDRPILYGLFVRHISLSFSLWLVIIFQAIIVTAVILYLFKYFIKTNKVFLKTFITIVLLGFLTGISNYTSQIMADIFASLSILCLISLFYSANLKWYNILFASLIVVFSGLSHLSVLATNTIISIIFIFLFIIFRKRFFKSISLKSILIVSLVMALSWILLPTLNYVYKSGFTTSRAKNVVLLSSFMDSDILIKYLEENCNKKNYPLCSDIEELKQINAAYKFLWEEKSPLYNNNCSETGGWGNCWIVKNKEYGLIISDMLKSMKYLLLIAKFELNKTYRQLGDFGIGILTTQVEGSPVISNIKNYYPDDYYQYTHAKQAFKTLTFETISLIQKITVYFSILALLIFFSIKEIRKQIKPKIKFLICGVIIGLLANAFICATFSNVVDRYQGRIIWLIPYLFIIIMMHYYNEIKTELMRKEN